MRTAGRALRVVVVCVGAGLGFATGRVAAQDAVPRVPAIVVTGESVVRRTPDVAFVTLATESRARSPREAQRQNAPAMAAVYQRLDTAGIKRDAVRTLAFDVHQAFDVTPDGRRAPREWIARNVIDVRLEDVDRVGDIIDVAVQGGATSVGGVRFDLRDRAAAEREALRLAVVDARDRADSAAAGAGQIIDRVLRIEDLRQPAMVMSRMAMVGAERVGEATTPIESGTVEISARVALTVSLK
jgi:uncharacterized protein YggE